MKNIRTQLFVLFITVLQLMGCGVQENIDLKSDQGMKIANAAIWIYWTRYWISA